MKEVDLYRPVKELFTSLGYDVKAEVSNIDVVAIKEESIIMIELKTSFNLKLVLQAIQRQKLSEIVYVAIPTPTSRQRFSKAFKEYEHLLKRLELGLILVNLKTTIPNATIVFEPKPFSRHASMSQNKKKKINVVREATSRHDDYNVGGTRGKLVTVYREMALLALSYMSELGEAKVKTLRELTGNEKMQAVLYQNYYGWFERVRNGVYKVSAQGELALDEYREVIEKMRECN